MKLDLQKLIVPTLPITVLTYVVSFAVWISFFVVYKFPFPMPGMIGSIAENWLSSGSLVAHIVSYAIVVLNSMLIAQMNNKFSFIRNRTFLPTFIYLFISVFWLPIHGNYIANLASFFVLLAVFLSLDMYKKTKGVEQAFLSFFLLALSSFLVPDYAHLILLFWLGYFFLKCFSGRVFFASIFGFITPWILFFTIRYFVFGEEGLISDIPAFLYQYTIFHYENIPAIVYAGIMLLILTSSIVQIAAKSYRENIQVRNELDFLKLMGFGVVMLFAFRFSNYVSYLSLIAIFYAILSAYTFTLVKSLFNSIVFIALFLFSFLFALYLVLI